MNCARASISFRIWCAICRSRVLSTGCPLTCGPVPRSAWTQRSSSLMGRAVMSLIDLSPTVTASASGRSRCPWQASQGRSLMYSSYLIRMYSEVVSRWRRAVLVSTPSN